MRPSNEDVQRCYDEVARLTRDGLNARTISDRLGVSMATVHRGRRARGVAQPVAPIDPDLLAKAEALLREGSGYAEASAVAGCCAVTLAKHFPGYGLPMSERVERMHLGRAMSRLDRSLR